MTNRDTTDAVHQFKCQFRLGFDVFDDTVHADVVCAAGGNAVEVQVHSWPLRAPHPLPVAAGT